MVNEELIIRQIVKSLDENGLLKRLQGNCITASDILSNLLFQKGISSYTTEVSATCYLNDKDTILIGFDGLFPETSRTDQIDTHVVVITTGKTPMLIDISIGNLLGSYKNVIIAPIINNEYIEGEVGGKKIVYSVKSHPKLVSLHEKTFLQRIHREAKLFSEVSILKPIIITSAALGLINFIINIVLYVTKT